MFARLRKNPNNIKCKVKGCRGSKHCPLAANIEERTELREIHIEMGATHPFGQSHFDEVYRLIRNAPLGCVVYDNSVK